MKAVLFGVLSLGVVAFASFAWADHHHNNGGGGGGHEAHQSNGGGGGGGHEPHGGGGGGGHESHRSEHMSFHGWGSSHDFMHEHVSGHHDSLHVSVHHNNYGHHSAGHVTIHGRNRNGFRGHVNLAHFHHVFRAPHRYRIGVWHAPRGFYYRRFGIGERVPAVLLVSSYFLNDYYNYGLEDPDDGYVWVRDGDDAVLVDEDTGEVVEVEYDVFY